MAKKDKGTKKQVNEEVKLAEVAEEKETVVAETAAEETEALEPAEEAEIAAEEPAVEEPVAEAPVVEEKEEPVAEPVKEEPKQEKNEEVKADTNEVKGTFIPKAHPVKMSLGFVPANSRSDQYLNPANPLGHIGYCWNGVEVDF